MRVNPFKVIALLFPQLYWINSMSASFRYMHWTSYTNLDMRNFAVRFTSFQHGLLFFSDLELSRVKISCKISWQDKKKKVSSNPSWHILSSLFHPDDTAGHWRPSIQLGTAFQWSSNSSGSRASSWGWPLLLPSYQHQGRGRWRVGHWIALGQLTYAPAKKTEILPHLPLLRMVAAFSNLIRQSKVWSTGDTASLTSPESSAKNKKHQTNFDFKFIIICSVWESV